MVGLLGRMNKMSEKYQVTKKDLRKANYRWLMSVCTFNYLTEAASVLGLTVVGSLIASVISVSTPLKFTFGEVSMKIQPMLDKILPTLIPVMITAAAYYLLSKKKISMTILILLVIVFAMVMAAFGILA